MTWRRNPWLYLSCDPLRRYAVLVPDPREQADWPAVFGYADSVEESRQVAAEAMEWLRKLDSSIPADADYTILVRNPKPIQTPATGTTKLPPKRKLATGA